MYTVVRKRTIGIEVGSNQQLGVTTKEQASQCPTGKKGSYNHQLKTGKPLNYDELLNNYLANKDSFLQWLKQENLIASSKTCPHCNSSMKWTETNDRSDGYKWECGQQNAGKRHKVELSIRDKSWFEHSNLTLEEIVKLTYWWCCGLTENQITHQLQLSSATVVDWTNFCREVCEVIIIEKSQPIGGKDVRVQIDGSKIGKCQYHRGHLVEGEWVFGGIEENSRKCFTFPVEDRSEATLLPIIKKWIRPESTIISDCWKGYVNLEKHGYKHKTINHSKEFVNDDGDNSDKIEGHWRQMKSSLPTHGRRKYHYSYLAKFLWQYTNKDNDLFWTFLEDIKYIYNPNKD